MSGSVRVSPDGDPAGEPAGVSEVEMVEVAGAHLVLAAQLLVGDVGGQVGVKDSAEGQTVVPAAAEVGDVDVLKTRGHHRLR